MTRWGVESATCCIYAIQQLRHRDRVVGSWLSPNNNMQYPWLPGVELCVEPWLRRQVRESMYQSLGLMSTSVAAFYGCGPAQELWGRSLMEHVDCMDHQHLRMLLRHLMLPFTKVCPPHHRSGSAHTVLPYYMHLLLLDWSM